MVNNGEEFLALWNHGQMTIAPRGKPVRIARTEDGNHRPTERGGQMRAGGIVADYGVGSLKDAEKLGPSPGVAGNLVGAYRGGERAPPGGG